MNLARDPSLVSDSAQFSDQDRVIGGVGWALTPKSLILTPSCVQTLAVSLDSWHLFWLLTAHYHWPVWIPITLRASLRDGSQGPVLTDMWMCVSRSPKCDCPGTRNLPLPL